MTPQVDQLKTRPEGNPDQMRENARLIKAHADHLRLQEGRSAKETRITGSGPLVERINQREEARTPAIQAQIKRLDDAAGRLESAATQVESDVKTWETQEKARSKGK